MSKERIKIIRILFPEIGKKNTERFITPIMKETFDYTKWQRDLWKDKSVEEISKEAMSFRKK